MNQIERILDANQNRCVEGLRVIEEYLRFIKDDGDFASEVRFMRHFIRKKLSQRWVMGRNSSRDVGKTVSKHSQLDNKSTLIQIIRANSSRVSESLRVIEEYLKLIDQYDLSKEIESKRFEFYTIEKRLLEEFYVSGLYALTAEGSKEEILNQVSIFIKHEVKWIQYRDKKRSYDEVLEIAKCVVDMTKGTRSRVIINDHVSIAMKVGAHGVHVGQGDLSVGDVRQMNKGMFVGVSTHNAVQFLKAVDDKPDYIALGPIFETKTKDNPEQCDGLSFAEFARKITDIPLVAIGGIDEGNLHKVKEVGVDAFAMTASIKEEEKLLKIRSMIGE